MVDESRIFQEVSSSRVHPGGVITSIQLSKKKLYISKTAEFHRLSFLIIIIPNEDNQSTCEMITLILPVNSHKAIRNRPVN